MQRYRIVILIVLLGIVPVVAAFFGALSFLKGEEVTRGAVAALPPAEESAAPPPSEPPATLKVLAAARALPIGTLIRDGDLFELSLDPEAVRREHLLAGEASSADLRGHAVREALASGEAIVQSVLIGPGQQGFLAAVLRPGARAVTIRVGPATSHAGLVDPGDRVDVILSAELRSNDRERSALARTIIEDVRVVAVDRRIGLSGSSRGGGDAARTEIVTATLEVSPAQGDRLVLGEHEGRLSLAVRSLAAAAQRTPSTAVDLRELLLSPEDIPPPPPAAEPVDADALEARLQREIASAEERLRARMEAERPPPEPDAPPLRAVRVFRGNDPAQEVLFRGKGRSQ